MLRSWQATCSHALRSFRATRAKSTNTASQPPRKPSTKPLPYSQPQPQKQQRQPNGSTKDPYTQYQNPPRLPWLQRLLPSLFYVVNLFIALHLTTKYLFTIRLTNGPSMLPTINYSGDWVLISKIHASMGWIEPGDLVSYLLPMYPGMSGIKRVIGMPGDFVLRDTPGKGDAHMVRLPEGHCWLVGDNLPASRDSRMFGALPLALVRGKVLCRVWPDPRLYNDGLTDLDDGLVD